MVSYVVMIMVFFLVYHKNFNNTVFTFILLITVAALMALASRRQLTGIERPWLRWVAFMFAVSALLGVIVGFGLYYQFLCYYWRYQDLRAYTNVAASQQADAFTDANMFLWTEDTRLDPMRSVGYKSRWTGQTYCVAPIVDGTMGSVAPISYWAVGENCCTARAEFMCDDAADITVRSALVILEPEDVVRPFMTWAVRDATYPKFKNAVALADATYSTAAASTVKLVKWVKDPIVAMNNFYSDATTKCIWTSILLYLVLQLICFVIAYYYIVIPGKDMESALRNEEK